MALSSAEFREYRHRNIRLTRRHNHALYGPDELCWCSSLYNFIRLTFTPTTKPQPLGHDENLYHKSYRILLGLLHACNIVPSALLISGVKLVEHDAVFYGVYADIFLASQHGQEVALKRPRRYIGHDPYKVQQVPWFSISCFVTCSRRPYASRRH